MNEDSKTVLALVSFSDHFNQQLKIGPPPVLKAGSYGNFN